MCGIAGMLSLKGEVGDREVRLVTAMTEALRHRGPDGHDIHRTACGRVVLGHRMLSIVDVGNSPQPFILAVDGGEIALTYNGEIYNYKDIRKVLEGYGRQFRTHGDTEVLLQAYLHWGPKAIEQFDGDFAFALFDGRSGDLVLGRDRLGVKPLFFHRSATCIAFASEPKALFPVLGRQLEIDPVAFADYVVQKDILTNTTSRPDKTLYRGIEALEAATIVVARGKSWRAREYWKLNTAAHTDRPQNWHATRIRAQVEQAIDERTPDEVRYGILLSGGLDSSLIGAHLVNRGETFAMTSINFTRGRNPDFAYAQRFAETFDRPLKAPLLSAAELIAQVGALVRAMDEPHDTSRQLGLMASYRSLRDEHCKVALVGEGSDEFNLGYYHAYPGLGKDIARIKTARDFRNLCLARLDFAVGWLSPDFRAQMNFVETIDESIERYFPVSDNVTPLDAMQHYYIKRFLKYRLDANDRCAMAHGIEARVPFCDHKAVETFLRVPDKLNIGKGLEKRVLRAAFKGVLPEPLLFRPKYALPENDSLGMHKELCREIDERLPRTGSHPIWDILDRTTVTAAVKDYRRKIIDGGETAAAAAQLDALMEPNILTAPPHLRAKHFFFLLTLLVWYEYSFRRD